MRRLSLLLVAVLMLAGCIHLDDLGQYWDNGTVDPALAGTWKKTGIAGQQVQIPNPELLIFTKAGNGYDLAMKNPGQPDQGPPTTVRTLAAGSGRLLILNFAGAAGHAPPMPGMPKGWLFRYDIEGDTLRQFYPRSSRIGALIAKYAASSGIELQDPAVLIVKQFDENVYRLLWEVASDPSYWAMTGEYRKQP